MFEQAAFVKALHDRRRRIERCERVFDSLFPFGVREIGAERNSETAPAERREPAHFQKKIALFLTELRRLAPIVNLQTRDDRVLRQRRWIEHPRVRNDFLKLEKIFLAKLAPP